MTYHSIDHLSMDLESILSAQEKILNNLYLNPKAFKEAFSKAEPLLVMELQIRLIEMSVRAQKIYKEYQELSGNDNSLDEMPF